MSFIKRKRGRPRRDEPREINEFDLALIEEFRKRPCFYDRAHQQYRNRDVLEPQWMEMAEKLGYNVSLVKDRMLQLRNRYNLEKRRVETLQEQYNDPDITSQWVLYDSLTFLGEHIKPRRTFLQQSLPIKSKQPSATNSSESEVDETADVSQHISNGKIAALAHLQLQLQQQQAPTQGIQTRHRHQISHSNTSTTVSSNSHKSISNQVNEHTTHPNTVDLRNTREINNSNYGGMDKFRAFGQFLASSLIEMNESDALRLVEKFTMDLVKALNQNHIAARDSDASSANEGCQNKRNNF